MPLNKFGCKRISSSDDRAERHVLIIWAFTVTLTLKTAKQPFRIPLWLMMMRHNTKFGDERFSGPEDLVWANIHWQFEVSLWPWPWTKQSVFVFFFFYKTLRPIIKFHKPSVVAKESAVTRYSKKIHISIIWTLAVTLTLKIENQFFRITLRPITVHHRTSLITKCSVVRKISSGQSLIDVLILCYDLNLKHSNPIIYRLVCWCPIKQSLVANGSAV